MATSGRSTVGLRARTDAHWSALRVISLLAVAVLGLVAAACAAAAPAASHVGYAQLQPVCHAPAPGTAGCTAVIRVPVAAPTADEALPKGVHPFVSGAGAYEKGPAHGLTPGDLASAYSFDPSGGAGQTVAVIDAYDDPDIEKDLASFDNEYALGECTTADHCFRKVNQEGLEAPLPPQDTTGWSLEISLDVEVTRAVCHGCNILLVEAENETDRALAKAVDEAAALGATEISNSYGGPETDDPSVNAAYDHPGIVVTAAGGDDGWDEWLNRFSELLEFGSELPAKPSAPASLPSVVSVGGTTLSLNENGTRASETVWNDGYGVSGGGCSTLSAAPAWQLATAGYIAAGCAGRRLANDVAADGDPLSGFDIADTYNCGTETEECEQIHKLSEHYHGWLTVGGTSLGTPLVAALYALAGGPRGMDYPALSLYAHLSDASALHDITAGGNGICDGESQEVCGHPNEEIFNDEPYFEADCEGTTACDAGPGYDGPSGVGTPDGLEAFKPLLPTAAITPPAAPTAGNPATFGSSGSHDPNPGATLRYHWNWGDGGTETTEHVEASHTYATSGTYTVTLTVTDSYGLAGTPVSAEVHVGTPPPMKVLKVKKEGSGAGSVTSSPPGIDCGSTCEASFEEGREATLTAAADPGSEVVKWTGCTTSVGSECKVRMSEAKSVAVEINTIPSKEAPAETKSPGTGSTGSSAGVSSGGQGVASFSSSAPRPVPDATLASTTLRVGGSWKVTLRISCPRGVSFCKGTATLRTIGAVKIGATAARSAKTAIVTLAAGSFTVAGGTTRTITLRLSIAAHSLLAAHHRLRVHVQLVARDGSGMAHTTVEAVTLLAPTLAHRSG